MPAHCGIMDNEKADSSAKLDTLIKVMLKNAIKTLRKSIYGITIGYIPHLTMQFFTEKLPYYLLVVLGFTALTCLEWLSPNLPGYVMTITDAIAYILPRY